METALYGVTFKDGRIFKVYCANKKQNDRFIKSYLSIDDKADYKIVVCGIHTIKQWEQIIKAENNQ